jgi:cell fate (sporulation/competence/biofilm development) regulator YlbF (YheA/YmcA/DUF963 family)
MSVQLFCMRFGKYHPDYQSVMLETRKRKRAYEMLDVVMDYKQTSIFTFSETA